MIRNITGYISGAGCSFDFSAGAFYRDLTVQPGQAGGTSVALPDDFYFDASRVVPTGPENTMKNISTLYCIRY